MKQKMNDTKIVNLYVKVHNQTNLQYFGKPLMRM